MRRTIPNLFRHAVEEAPDKVWLLADTGALTFSEALDRIERGASWCRAAGVEPGDRVLVTARNTPDYLLSWLALMEVGAIQVPINPASLATEVTGFVGQAEPHLIVTDAALAPVYLSRGILAGTKRYAAYGLQLALEGALRFVLAVALFVLGSHSTALFGAILCVAALVATGITWPRSVSRQRTQTADDQRPFGSAIGWMLCGTVAAQLLANAGPIVIRAIASPHDAVAGRFLTALVIARIPLFLFAAVQAVLLPGLARLHADRDRPAFVTGVQRLVVTVIALGGVATTTLLIGGPALTRMFFGQTYRSSGGALALLSLGCTVFLLAGVLAQAILAIRRPGSTALGWSAGLASFALFLLVPCNLVVRVSAALLVGSITAVGYFATVLLRAKSADDGALGAQ